MGQKVHPYGLRLGIIRQPKSTWFAEGPVYRDQLVGDVRIRRHLDRVLANAGVSSVHIERAAGKVIVTIQTAKPGIIIGRGGRDVEILRRNLEKIAGQEVRVNVEETKDPDLDATLVAQNIARQIERRVSFRRAMRQAIERALKLGAQGIRVTVSGRLQGAEIARTESMGPEGRVPLHTLRADVTYGLAEARTGYGHIGVKVWIYKGDILPPRKVKPSDLYVPEEEEQEAEAEAAQEATAEAQEAQDGAEAPAEAPRPAETPAAPADAAPAAQQPAPADQVEDAFVEREPAYDPQDTVIAAEAIEEGEEQ